MASPITVDDYDDDDHESGRQRLVGAFPVVDTPHCQIGGGGGGGIPIDWSDQWTQWPCRPFSPLLDAPYFTINQMSNCHGVERKITEKYP